MEAGKEPGRAQWGEKMGRKRVNTQYVGKGVVVFGVKRGDLPEEGSGKFVHFFTCGGVLTGPESGDGVGCGSRGMDRKRLHGAIHQWIDPVQWLELAVAMYLPILYHLPKRIQVTRNSGKTAYWTTSKAEKENRFYRVVIKEYVGTALSLSHWTRRQRRM
jgi:hypothetical protein